MPFLLKFTVNTQVRYLNTLSSEDTFTDHLGVVRDVNNRNDITVNRAMCPGFLRRLDFARASLSS